jgi:hypothetical protein
MGLDECRAELDERSLAARCLREHHACSHRASHSSHFGPGMDGACAGTVTASPGLRRRLAAAGAAPQCVWPGRKRDHAVSHRKAIDHARWPSGRGARGRRPAVVGALCRRGPGAPRAALPRPGDDGPAAAASQPIRRPFCFCAVSRLSPGRLPVCRPAARYRQPVKARGDGNWPLGGCRQPFRVGRVATGLLGVNVQRITYQLVTRHNIRVREIALTV